MQGVFTDGPVRFVYAQKSGRYERVPIKLGKRSDTFAEILAGTGTGRTILLRDPTPSEVLAGNWDKPTLELAGYTLDEKGNPIVKETTIPRTAVANAKKSESKPATEAAATPADGTKPVPPAVALKPLTTKVDNKQADASQPAK